MAEEDCLLPGHAAELLDEIWRLFTEALTPLKASGKLGALHFQFAPWLLFSPQARITYPSPDVGCPRIC